MSAAGEFLVAARLSAMGYVVALPCTSPALDRLGPQRPHERRLAVTSADGARALALRVWTTAADLRNLKRPDGSCEWELGGCDRQSLAPDLWCAFVDLNGRSDLPASAQVRFPSVLLVPGRDVIGMLDGGCGRPLVLRMTWNASLAYRERWDRLQQQLDP